MQGAKFIPLPDEALDENTLQRGKGFDSHISS